MQHLVLQGPLFSKPAFCSEASRHPKFEKSQGAKHRLQTSKFSPFDDPEWNHMPGEGRASSYKDLNISEKRGDATFERTVFT